MPRSWSTVPPPRSSAQIWCGRVVSSTRELVTESTRARSGALASLILAAIADTVSPGARRISAPSMTDRGRRLDPVLAGVHRGVDLLLLCPEGDVAGQVHLDLGAFRDLRRAGADVAQVVDGDHHVAAAAGHAAHRSRGRAWSSTRSRRTAQLPLWSLELAMTSSSSRSWFTSSPMYAIWDLSSVPLAPCTASSRTRCRMSIGAAEVALHAGQRVAHALDVLAVAFQPRDLGLEARGAGRGQRIVAQVLDPGLRAHLVRHLVHVELAQALVVAAVLRGKL